MNKNAIKKFAIDARNKLIASVTDKAGMLGITPDNCSEAITKGADFEVYKTAAGTEVTLNKKQCEQRRKLVDQIHARGFEAVVEEVAYTWFNRICAIRFMEVNDYMYPVRVRVLSSEKEGKNEPDVVTMAPDIDWDFTDKEREEIIDTKMNNRLDDLFRMLFIKQCNLLHEVLPGLFEETEDYTEMLLNISFTNEDDVIRMLIDEKRGIPEEDFNVNTIGEDGQPTGQVEIIGWLYQYYNTELKPASENEVFNACAEAIEEIHKLVRKLTIYVSTPKFFITADHGFLYKRDRLQEFDKVSYPKDKCLYTNKRFLITEDAVNEQGIMARTMAYLNKLYVDTPVGADIFKVAGGGQNYVHGGTSLQEMIVPVIELTTNTRGVAYDYVDIVLTSVTRKVTNLITYFDFIQTEKVTDTMKARSIVAYFTTEDGEKISFDVPMIANSREDAPEKRTFHEKFTLKSREYKYGDKYYLVLADANDEKNILQQYEFMIDIAFVDDFGF